ncbi:hypothetical protein [Polaromonas sp.]|uniref:hypothetical protein n=1 Tax=Polaromonas sp. TaxID=1869339 RepID=UPI00286D3807|nr:hypothetical protein [Polaromonas sp.]
MTTQAKVLLALGSVCLASCALIAPSGEAVVRKVVVQGESYNLSQLTAGTWVAILAGAPKPVNRGASKAELLRAIEQASGCKVTDSDYSRQGQQLDAQVDCGERMAN